jgi:hypothetical protein
VGQQEAQAKSARATGIIALPMQFQKTTTVVAGLAGFKRLPKLDAKWNRFSHLDYNRSSAGQTVNPRGKRVSRPIGSQLDTTDHANPQRFGVFS